MCITKSEKLNKSARNEVYIQRNKTKVQEIRFMLRKKEIKVQINKTQVQKMRSRPSFQVITPFFFFYMWLFFIDHHL